MGRERDHDLWIGWRSKVVVSIHALVLLTSSCRTSTYRKETDVNEQSEKKTKKGKNPSPVIDGLE